MFKVDITMLKKLAFMLVAIGAFSAGNQSSAQAESYRFIGKASVISVAKSCPRRRFNGTAVRDSKLAAMRLAKQRWKNNVRKSLSVRYTNWSHARVKRLRCGYDRIEQNYRCHATAVPCSKRTVLAPRPKRPVYR